MTNHEPNDLSHLSDAEFNSLCPQGEHAPGPEPLSPAAQAVLDAFGKHPLHSDYISDGLLYGALPAALRAAADEVGWDWEPCSQLLAIANELERQ